MREICENTVLLSKGIARVFSSKIPTDPHTIAEHYLCDSDAVECMLGQCDECSDHGLKSEDFEKTLSAGYSDSDSEEREFGRTVGFYEWKRGDNGYMMKSQVILSIEDALTLWNSKVQRLKEHIFTKRQQQGNISYRKVNIKVNEVLIHLDYSENYKSQDENEIQSAYFGQASFSLFTACPYYRCSETNEVRRMPTTIASEASDKSRMASITSVKKVIDHVLSKIVNKIDMVYIANDGCASQFRSKFVFKLLILIHPEIGLEWHYNEAHHEKGLMDGIAGIVKNTVFRKVLSDEVVIGSPEEFARYANQICQVDSLCLPTAEISDEPEDVQYSSPTPDTLKTHRMVRGLSKHKIPYLKFYYMSTDPEPHYTQRYGPECGPVENGQDENTCAFCLKSYNAVDNDVEWIKCPICDNWFHEQCFFVE